MGGGVGRREGKGREGKGEGEDDFEVLGLGWFFFSRG